MSGPLRQSATDWMASKHQKLIRPVLEAYVQDQDAGLVRSHDSSFLGHMAESVQKSSRGSLFKDIAFMKAPPS